MQFEDVANRVAEVRGVVEAAVRRGGHGQLVELVAVTKTHGPEAVQAAWDAGVRCVGENKVQEALGKMEQVTAPVQWHLIGHLQRNKAKHVSRFALFHAVDSMRLAEAIDEVGAGKGEPVRVLIQVNASGEESKGGFSVSTFAHDVDALVRLRGLRIEGVMTMAPFDAEERTLRETFAGARTARETLRQAGCDARELSMGMSGDYEIAVEEGATLIRLGTILFGART